MMEAGKLRHRVTIESPDTAEGEDYGHGGGATAWTPVATVWAEVRPVRAMEAVRAGQPGMETTYIVRMRFRSDVKPEHRLLWNGQALHISSVIPVDGRNAELEIVAHEREGVPSA